MSLPAIAVADGVKEIEIKKSVIGFKKGALFIATKEGAYKISRYRCRTPEYLFFDAIGEKDVLLKVCAKGCGTDTSMFV